MRLTIEAMGNLFRRKKPASFPDVLPASEFKCTLSEVFDSRLLDLGFEQSQPLIWTRSRGQIRDMVELVAIKGASRAARWGFSLDFVPHIVAHKNVQWHRTPKSASLDIVWDPLDWGDRSFLISAICLPQELLENVTAVVGKVEVEIEKHLTAVQNVEDLPSVYEEWKNRETSRFGFSNYVQASLGMAFTMARLGEERQARYWLSKFIESENKVTELDHGTVLHLNELLDRQLGKSA